jgi:hypothetical protein
MICRYDDLCHVTYEILAEIIIFELPSNKSIISDGFQCSI